jgi:hypothetical protein
MTKPKLKEPMQPDPPKPDSPVPGPIEPRKKKPSERMHALAKVPQQPSLLEILDRAANDPAVDAVKVTALYDILTRERADSRAQAYQRDLIRMLPNLPKIAKDGMIEIEAKLGKRGQKTPYVTLDTVVEKLTPVLVEYGFGFQWCGDTISAQPGNPIAIMTLTMYHVEGHSKTARREVLPEPSGSKNPEQARGSGETYTKRYLLRQLVPFVSSLKEDRDDDAQATGAMEEDDVITKEQVKKLRKEIKDCGVDETVFAEHFGPPEKLPVKALNEAIDRCRQFKANRGGDRAAAQG